MNAAKCIGIFFFVKMNGDAVADSIGTWSSWTLWSECSRSCDGGASYQQRQCIGGQRCHGDNMRYRTCNIDPCPEGSLDFRSQQCAVYNDVTYKGRLYTWTPYTEETDPCALHCRAKGFRLKVKLEPTVLDGTRCRRHSRDMCINGRCRAVGCNGTQLLDACGVCGGDSSSCTAPVYAWKRTDYSACSDSCGVGEQHTTVYCEEEQTHLKVDETYCDKKKPLVKTRTCRITKCEPTWIISDYSPCSKTCGRGSAVRHVYCVRPLPDSDAFKRISDSLCEQPKPETIKTCNPHLCPIWFAGAWSPCSVSCESGRQSRGVFCRRTRHHDCSPPDRPITDRSCTVDVVCPKENQESRQVESDNEPTEEKYKKEKGIVSFDRSRSPEGQDLIQLIQPDKSMLLEQVGGNGDDTADQAHFFTTTWSHCSTTCGSGVRKRQVECKKYLPASRKLLLLSDDACQGKKPIDFELCNDRPCNVKEGIKGGFDWRFSGYTPCSASCLGGVRESVYTCVKLRDYRPLFDDFCAELPKPPLMKKTCNDIPCPPRWRIGDYGACSVDCGGGDQIRPVECVQEAGRGPAGNVTVAVLEEDGGCPSPPPPASRPCNVIDCPARWTISDWSQCSETCGRGLQVRSVACQQTLKNGTVHPADGCSTPAPPSRQACIITPTCPAVVSPAAIKLRTSVLEFVQMRPRSRILIMAEGRAVISPGTIIYMRCRVKKTVRTRIQWRKDGNVISRKGRVRPTKKGELLIVKSRYGDSGVYSCSTGNHNSSVTLTFHSLQEAHDKYRFRKRVIGMYRGFYKRLARRDRDEKVRNRKIQTFGHILRRYNVTVLPLFFAESPWSACSRSCGGAGLQSRRITCELLMRKYYFVVDDGYCYRRGLHKSLETKDCGFEDCSHWDTGTWSRCKHRRCLRDGVGSMTRPLFCTSGNGSIVHSHHCDQSAKPVHLRGCVSPGCIATWTLSDWSQCSVTCGGEGLITRSLRCVWRNTGEPAGVNCRGRPKPIVTKPCRALPCSHTVCRDKSTFCNLAPMLQLCRYEDYRRECCRSCQPGNSRKASNGATHST